MALSKRSDARCPTSGPGFFELRHYSVEGVGAGQCGGHGWWHSGVPPILGVFAQTASAVVESRAQTGTDSYQSSCQDHPQRSEAAIASIFRSHEALWPSGLCDGA